MCVGAFNFKLLALAKLGLLTKALKSWNLQEDGSPYPSFKLKVDQIGRVSVLVFQAKSRSDWTGTETRPPVDFGFFNGLERMKTEPDKPGSHLYLGSLACALSNCGHKRLDRGVRVLVARSWIISYLLSNRRA